MMHLDAIVKRNRRPERQPSETETRAFKDAHAIRRTERYFEMVGPLTGRTPYVREV
ncbi:hypothetical protein [Reyranella sp.]|uniref:hypothetical protein n=1 Tax=Reyranella sp. TaxID=1929291 RepID=UPI0025FDC794|nr:hypothetical protein [Reyranella sp.]